MNAPKLKRRDALELAELAGAVAITARQMLTTANAMTALAKSGKIVDEKMSGHADEMEGAAKTANEWARAMMAEARR